MHYVHNFQLDEKLYKTGVINDDNSISISMLKRYHFPRDVIKSYFNNALNRGHIDNFNCFYTGIECWVGKDVDRYIEDEKIRFILSKEHLSSIKAASILGLTHRVHHKSNLIGVSSYFNYKIGHIPLVLKLWIKKQLESCEYSREELTKANSYIVLKYIIELQDKLRYKNLYPWQPNTYLDKNECKISQSILQEMLEVDKEFLLIDKAKDSAFWLKSYNPGWIEKFIL